MTDPSPDILSSENQENSILGNNQQHVHFGRRCKAEWQILSGLGSEAKRNRLDALGVGGLLMWSLSFQKRSIINIVAIISGVFTLKDGSVCYCMRFLKMNSILTHNTLAERMATYMSMAETHQASFFARFFLRRFFLSIHCCQMDLQTSMPFF